MSYSAVPTVARSSWEELKCNLRMRSDQMRDALRDVSTVGSQCARVRIKFACPCNIPISVNVLYHLVSLEWLCRKWYINHFHMSSATHRFKALSSSHSFEVLSHCSQIGAQYPQTVHAITLKCPVAMRSRSWEYTKPADNEETGVTCHW